MVTVLLLLPVFAILVWLYWYLLPARRWLPADSLVMLVLVIGVAVFIRWVEWMDFDAGGPLWPYVVSAAGAYGILIFGLGVALAWRWYRVKS